MRSGADRQKFRDPFDDSQDHGEQVVVQASSSVSETVSQKLMAPWTGGAGSRVARDLFEGCGEGKARQSSTLVVGQPDGIMTNAKRIATRADPLAEDFGGFPVDGSERGRRTPWSK